MLSPAKKIDYLLSDDFFAGLVSFSNSLEGSRSVEVHVDELIANPVVGFVRFAKADVSEFSLERGARTGD